MCDSENEFCYGMGEKHCGKRRKCWSPAFSPFPTMFSKDFFHRSDKSRDCVVKGLRTPIGGYQNIMVAV